MFLSGGVPEICPGSFPGNFRGPEIPVLGPEVPVQENLAKSFFVFFSLEGVRNFAPEVSPEISGDRKFRPLTPEVPASRGCNGQILGEAIGGARTTTPDLSVY